METASHSSHATTRDTDSASLRQIMALLVELKAELAGVKSALGSRQKPVLTIEEIAELTGRSAYTIRRWVKERRLTATRIQGTGPKGRLLVSRDEIDKILRSGLGANVPDAAID